MISTLRSTKFARPFKQKTTRFRRLKARLRESEKATIPRNLSYVSASDLRGIKAEVAKGHEKITNLHEDMDKKDHQLQQVKKDPARGRKH